jgi:mono/diheme cytochrome c family protein
MPIRPLAVFCLLGLSACGSGRRSEPLVGPVRLDSAEERRGEQAFFRFCHQCHPGGDSGLGPALNNKPLPGAAIRLQVRTGVGNMPSINDDELSDRDLDAIVAYMKALRQAE